MVQILQSNTFDKNHIFNRFMWGSKKSLKKHGDIDILWDDLKKFFEEQYSADRMKLVI